MRKLAIAATLLLPVPFAALPLFALLFDPGSSAGPGGTDDAFTRTIEAPDDATNGGHPSDPLARAGSSASSSLDCDYEADPTQG